MEENERPHVLCDTAENRAQLTPVSVRLYNALAEVQRILRDRLPGEYRGVYEEASRALRDARYLAQGVMPPQVLRRIIEDDDGVTVQILVSNSIARRIRGPNTPMPRYPFEVLYEVDRKPPEGGR